MRIWRAILIAVCVCVLAVAAAGCGSSGGGGSSKSSGIKPEAWATSVCTALGDWAHAIQAGSTKLSTDLHGSKSLPEVKAKFVAFIEDAKTQSDTLLAKIHATGPPAVDNGEALQRDFEAEIAKFRTSFVRATAKAKALPTNNAQAFTTGVSSLGQEIQTELSATGEGFKMIGTKYKSSDLNTMTKTIPACQKIGA